MVREMCNLRIFSCGSIIESASDTSTPVVEAADASTMRGDRTYTAGDEVDVRVTFDYDVAAAGYDGTSPPRYRDEGVAVLVSTGGAKLLIIHILLFTARRMPDYCRKIVLQ